MLHCLLLAHLCTLDDLLEFNDTTQACTHRAMEEDSLMTRYDDDSWVCVVCLVMLSVCEVVVVTCVHVVVAVTDPCTVVCVACVYAESVRVHG